MPRLSAVKEADMPSNTPSHQLATPTAEEWRAEVRARRAGEVASTETKTCGGVATCATHGAWTQQCTEGKVHGVGVHHVWLSAVRNVDGGGGTSRTTASRTSPSPCSS